MDSLFIIINYLVISIGEYMSRADHSDDEVSAEVLAEALGVDFDWRDHAGSDKASSGAGAGAGAGVGAGGSKPQAKAAGPDGFEANPNANLLAIERLREVMGTFDYQPGSDYFGACSWLSSITTNEQADDLMRDDHARVLLRYMSNVNPGHVDEQLKNDFGEWLYWYQKQNTDTGQYDPAKFEEAQKTLIDKVTKHHAKDEVNQERRQFADVRLNLKLAHNVLKRQSSASDKVLKCLPDFNVLANVSPARLRQCMEVLNFQEVIQEFSAMESIPEACQHSLASIIAAVADENLPDFLCKKRIGGAIPDIVSKLRTANSDKPPSATENPLRSKKRHRQPPRTPKAARVRAGSEAVEGLVACAASPVASSAAHASVQDKPVGRLPTSSAKQSSQQRLAGVRVDALRKRRQSMNDAATMFSDSDSESDDDARTPPPRKKAPSRGRACSGSISAAGRSRSAAGHPRTSGPEPKAMAFDDWVQHSLLAKTGQQSALSLGQHHVRQVDIAPAAAGGKQYTLHYSGLKQAMVLSTNDADSSAVSSVDFVAASGTADVAVEQKLATALCALALMIYPERCDQHGHLKSGAPASVIVMDRVPNWLMQHIKTQHTDQSDHQHQELARKMIQEQLGTQGFVVRFSQTQFGATSSTSSSSFMQQRNAKRGSGGSSRQENVPVPPKTPAMSL